MVGHDWHSQIGVPGDTQKCCDPPSNIFNSTRNSVRKLILACAALPLFAVATHVIFSGECLRLTTGTDDLAAGLARMAQFTDAFIAVEIDSSKGNPHGIPRVAHSVLTQHFVDEAGHPTSEALDRVLDFFAERLRPPPAKGEQA